MTEVNLGLAIWAALLSTGLAIRTIIGARRTIRIKVTYAWPDADLGGPEIATVHVRNDRARPVQVFDYGFLTRRGRRYDDEYGVSPRATDPQSLALPRTLLDGEGFNLTYFLDDLIDNRDQTDPIAWAVVVGAGDQIFRGRAGPAWPIQRITQLRSWFRLRRERRAPAPAARPRASSAPHRSTFSPPEIETLRESLTELRSADRDRQKAIRASMRRLGFYITDYTPASQGFTVSDFDELVRRGVITVSD